MSSSRSYFDGQRLLEHSKIKQFALNGALIMICLASGVILFAAFTVVQVKVWNMNLGVLTVLSMVMMAVAVNLNFLIPRWFVAKASNSLRKSEDVSARKTDPPADALQGPLSKVLDGILASFVIRGAAFEGAAFLGVIAAFIEHSLFGLAVAALGVLALLALTPTRSRIVHLLERVVEESKGAPLSSF